MPPNTLRREPRFFLSAMFLSLISCPQQTTAIGLEQFLWHGAAL
jgi:hypothetical protein